MCLFFFIIFIKNILNIIFQILQIINYFNQSFSIPIYPSLKTSDQNKIKNLIKKLSKFKMINLFFSYTKYIKSYFITVLFLIGTLTILNSLKPIILSGTFNLIVKELNFQVESSGNNGTDTSKKFFLI